MFREDGDRTLWIETLGEAVEKTGWKVHAYVLMDNHYHFLLETPMANLVKGMKWFQGTFTQRINASRKERGHLFQGRYKALIVDPEEKMYFTSIGTYIHMNPVRAGLIGEERGDLRDYVWSSYPWYLARPKRRPSWLVVSRLLGSLGLPDRARDRRAYGDFMEEQILEWRTRKGKRTLNRKWKEIRRGWYFGGEHFRDFLIERLEGIFDGKQRDSFKGEGARFHDEWKAEKRIAIGLDALGLAEEDLKEMKKGALEKAVIAWLIRRHSVVGNRWIGSRLSIGGPSYVSKLVKNVKEARRGRLGTLKEKLGKLIR